jgi:arylsulfatase B
MLRRRVLPGGGQGRRVFGDIVYGTHMGYNEPDYDANNPIVRGSQPVAETAYLTDAWTREAVDFIDRHRDKPFFLYLAHNAVHSPLQGAAAYLQKFGHIEDLQRRIFAAMLANLDDSVGAVLQKVRETDLEQDTLVIFLSDNGGPTRELTSSNLPLRGEKGQMYEGGIRVPCMICWPGRLPAGKVNRDPISSVDLHATALAIAGAEPAPNSDGVNLVPILSGSQPGRPHQTLYWRQGLKTAIRVGDWKLLRHGRRGQPGEWEIYNLRQDISESNNLATSEPDKLAELVLTWRQLDQQMVPPTFK